MDSRFQRYAVGVISAGEEDMKFSTVKEVLSYHDPITNISYRVEYVQGQGYSAIYYLDNTGTPMQVAAPSSKENAMFACEAHIELSRQQFKITPLAIEDSVWNRVVKLAASHHVSKDEMIRRCVATFSYLDDRIREGGHIEMIDIAGNRTPVLLEFD